MWCYCIQVPAISIQTAKVIRGTLREHAIQPLNLSAKNERVSVKRIFTDETYIFALAFNEKLNNNYKKKEDNSERRKS